MNYYLSKKKKKLFMDCLGVERDPSGSDCGLRLKKRKRPWILSKAFLYSHLEKIEVSH
jgi:hypothetical protein